MHSQDDKSEEKPETAGEEPNSLAIAGIKNLTLLSEEHLELVIAGMNDVCATIWFEILKLGVNKSLKYSK